MNTNYVIEYALLRLPTSNDDRFGVVVGILAYSARGRGFDSRTVQSFVCINMSICIRSECFYVKYVCI
jgi:hypothetical protein